LRAVFDSNIFISALVIPGGQAEAAIEAVISGQVELCLSREIIHEVLRVLADKFSRDAEELARAAVFLSELSTPIATKLRLAVLEDEPDNRILECAVTGRADVVVTGDRTMLRLRKHEGIRILSLRQFLDEIAG
jgi:putative PIN family toxin of toxin-antitoxin system